MLVKAHASAVHGVDAFPITVEVNAGGIVAAGKQYYFWLACRTMLSKKDSSV